MSISKSKTHSQKSKQCNLARYIDDNAFTDSKISAISPRPRIEGEEKSNQLHEPPTPLLSPASKA
jgi:hypothetical protein